MQKSYNILEIYNTINENNEYTVNKSRNVFFKILKQLKILCAHNDWTVYGKYLNDTKSGVIYKLYNSDNAPQRKDLVGQKFGRLTVLERERDFICKNGSHMTRWKCICDCNEHNIVTVRYAELTTGKSTSCGCARYLHNTYKFVGDIGICYYNQNDGFFIFDTEDYNAISKYTWRNSSGYAKGNHGDEEVFAHRIITRCDSGYEVDHKNHLRNDNRKINLRKCTHSENLKNYKKPTDDIILTRDNINDILHLHIKEQL